MSDRGLPGRPGHRGEKRAAPGADRLARRYESTCENGTLSQVPGGKRCVEYGPGAVQEKIDEFERLLKQENAMLSDLNRP